MNTNLLRFALIASLISSFSVFAMEEPNKQQKIEPRNSIQPTLNTAQSLAALSAKCVGENITTEQVPEVFTEDANCKAILLQQPAFFMALPKEVVKGASGALLPLLNEKLADSVRGALLLQLIQCGYLNDAYFEWLRARPYLFPEIKKILNLHDPLFKKAKLFLMDQVSDWGTVADKGKDITSKDSRYRVSCDDKGQIRIESLDMDNNRVCLVFDANNQNYANSVAIAKNGSYLVNFTNTYELVLWTFNNGEYKRTVIDTVPGVNIANITLFEDVTGNCVIEAITDNHVTHYWYAVDNTWGHVLFDKSEYAHEENEWRRVSQYCVLPLCKYMLDYQQVLLLNKIIETYERKEKYILNDEEKAQLSNALEWAPNSNFKQLLFLQILGKFCKKQ